MFYTKLTAMPYAQAKVAIFCSDPKSRRCALISYNTRVADIIEGGWVIVNGLIAEPLSATYSPLPKSFAALITTLSKSATPTTLRITFIPKSFTTDLQGR